MRSFMISLLLAISVDFSHGVAQTAVPIQKNFEMQVEDLGRISPKTSTMLVSPDRKHFAYTSTKGSRQVVVVDGSPSPGFTEIEKGSLKFTADSSKLVFVAKERNTEHVVVVKNGNVFVSEGYKEVLEVHVSPVGNRIAWAVRNKGYEGRMVVDGKPEQESQEIKESSFQFSPDGAHYWYLIKIDGKHRYVVDGTPGQWQVSNFDCEKTRFLAAPFRLVFLSRLENRLALVVQTADGKASLPSLPPHVAFQNAHIAVSANHQHYALAYQSARSFQSKKWEHNFWVDGQQIQSMPEISDQYVQTLSLSPDAKHLAFTASAVEHNRVKHGINTVFVGGKQGYEYGKVSSVQFSPDGTSHVYVASNKQGNFVVVNGEEFGPYTEVSLPQYLSNESDIVWVAEQDRKRNVYLNGKPAENVPYLRKIERQFDFVVKLNEKHEAFTVNSFNRRDYYRYRPQLSSISSDGTMHSCFEPERSKCDISRISKYDTFTLKTNDVVDRWDGGVAMGVDAPQTYKLPSNLHFAPNSANVLFTSQAREPGVEESKIRWLSIDGQFAPACAFESSTIPTGMHFPSPTTVSYYGLRDGSLKRFTVEIASLKKYAVSLADSRAKTPFRNIYSIPDLDEDYRIGDLNVDQGVFYASLSPPNPERNAMSIVRIDPARGSFEVLAKYESGYRANCALLLGNDDWLYGESNRGIFRIKTNGERFQYLIKPDDLLANKGKESSIKLLGFTSNGLLVLFCNRANELWTLTADGGQATNIFANDETPIGESGRKRLSSEIMDELKYWVIDGDDLFLLGHRKGSKSLVKVELGSKRVTILRDFDSKFGFSKLALNNAGQFEIFVKDSRRDQGPAILTLNKDGSDFKTTLGLHPDEHCRKNDMGYSYTTRGVRADSGGWYFIHHSTVSELAKTRISSVFKQSADREEIDRICHISGARILVRAYVHGTDGKLYGVADIGEKKGQLFSIDTEFKAPPIIEMRTNFAKPVSQPLQIVDQLDGVGTSATVSSDSIGQLETNAPAATKGDHDIGSIESVNQKVEEYYKSLKRMWLLDVKIAALNERLALLKNQKVRRDPMNEFVRANESMRRTYIDGFQGIGSVNSHSIRNHIESKLLAAALVTDPEQRNALYRKYESERIATNADRVQRTVVTDRNTLRKKVNAEVTVKLAQQMKQDYDSAAVNRLISKLEKKDSQVSYGLQKLAIKMFVYQTPKPQNLDDVFDLEQATEKELKKLVAERAQLSTAWSEHPLRSRANSGTHLAGQGQAQETKMRNYWASIAQLCVVKSDFDTADKLKNEPRIVVDNFGIDIYFPRSVRNSRLPVKIELRRGDGREGLRDGIPTQIRPHRMQDTRKYPRFFGAIDLDGFVVMSLGDQTLDDIEQLINVKKLASLAPDFSKHATVSIPELLSFLELDPSSVQPSKDIYILQLK